MLALAVSVAMLTALSLAEHVWPASRAPTFRALNLGIWALLIAAQTLLQPVVAIGTVWAINRLGGGCLDLSALPFPLGLAAFFLAMDLGEYLFHRAQHAVPALWELHALHHSDSNMTATTAARHYWADPLLKSVTVWLAVGLAMKATPAILTAYAALGAYNFFTHANLPLNFGRWSWAINAPAYHRVHHSREPADYDTNFAGVLPIFDVIFGTYRQPRHSPETGLEHWPANLLQAALWPAWPKPAEPTTIRSAGKPPSAA